MVKHRQRGAYPNSEKITRKYHYDSFDGEYHIARKYEFKDKCVKKPETKNSQITLFVETFVRTNICALRLRENKKFLRGFIFAHLP